MQESRDDLMSIVVLETGAAWPVWLTEQRLAPHAVVIAQARAEGLDGFRVRVLHRIAEATTSSGARVSVGVIVAAPAAGEERLEFRESVARALLQRMGSGAELVLAGDGHETDPARHELFTIAGALCEELGGSKVNVRVRFSSSKSGVMCSVEPATPDAKVASKDGA